ncbi:hypothetical protein GCM10027605_06120 [Micromonospora zhanjiangensis]
MSVDLTRPTGKIAVRHFRPALLTNRLIDRSRFSATETGIRPAPGGRLRRTGPAATGPGEPKVLVRPAWAAVADSTGREPDSRISPPPIGIFPSISRFDGAVRFV